MSRYEIPSTAMLCRRAHASSAPATMSATMRTERRIAYSFGLMRSSRATKDRHAEELVVSIGGVRGAEIEDDRGRVADLLPSVCVGPGGRIVGHDEAHPGLSHCIEDGGSNVRPRTEFVARLQLDDDPHV